MEHLIDPLGELPAGTRASVGLAGVHRRRSAAIAEWLRDRLRSDHVVVARDVDLVLSQLEGHGAALVAGTGAIAVGRGPAGEVVVDGAGSPAAIAAAAPGSGARRCVPAWSHPPAWTRGTRRAWRPSRRQCWRARASRRPTP